MQKYDIIGLIWFSINTINSLVLIKLQGNIHSIFVFFIKNNEQQTLTPTLITIFEHDGRMETNNQTNNFANKESA